MSPRPTRAQLLGALVFDAIAQSRITWREYAIAVVDHYHAHVARDDRAVEFQAAATTAQFEAVVRNNTQSVRRYVAGERVLAADLEESLIAALPAPWPERIHTALLARAGLLYARKPPAATDTPGQVRTSTELLRRAADAVDAIAPMLDDHRICPDDAMHFAPALVAINGVMGACLTLSAQIHGALAQVQPQSPRIARPAAPEVH